ETSGRRAALGTYNFSGDLGKVAVPAAVGLAAAFVGWRIAGAAYGGLGLLGALLILPLLAGFGAGEVAPRERETTATATTGWGIRDSRGFGVLSAIGMIDNATRTGFITFLPFALIAKGLTVAGVGGALAVLFAGGATGKFVCGLIAERLGVIRTVVLTETATAIGILVILAAPLSVAIPVLLPVGIALNGTSTVLYGTVADLVRPERRSRAYGLYYTLTIAASAMAPSVYGVLSDAVGVPITLGVIATLVLVTIPLCLALRPSVAAPARA
ncbi:MAG: MFS transporter, partial [Candidatus Rokubacteria bacterium]|nr:MFS transporter [Candidatus Rokubacteria bacterium]